MIPSVRISLLLWISSFCTIKRQYINEEVSFPFKSCLIMSFWRGIMVWKELEHKTRTLYVFKDNPPFFHNVIRMYLLTVLWIPHGKESWYKAIKNLYTLKMSPLSLGRYRRPCKIICKRDHPYLMERILSLWKRNRKDQFLMREHMCYFLPINNLLK